MAPRQARRGLKPNLLIELPVLAIVLLVVCSCIVDAARSRGSSLETDLEHKGEWAIKLSPRADETLESLANRVAADLGLISLGQVCSGSSNYMHYMHCMAPYTSAELPRLVNWREYTASGMALGHFRRDPFWTCGRQGTESPRTNRYARDARRASAL
jgi:hypothetical protein